MFRNHHRQIQEIVQRLTNMAGSSSTNLDAAVSKISIEADKAHGVDAFEAASLQIPETGRPGSDSPLSKTFALEEEPKADDDQAEAQVTEGSWVCCMCGAANEVAGSASQGCWGCESHACGKCQSA